MEFRQEVRRYVAVSTRDELFILIVFWVHSPMRSAVAYFFQHHYVNEGNLPIGSDISEHLGTLIMLQATLEC